MLLVQLGLIVGLAAFSLLPTPALAVNTGTDQPDTESILLSPTSKRYTLEAGTTQKDSFKIVNDGSKAYDFVVYARPYSVTDESYVPDFVSTAQNADAYKWVQFDKTSYSIEPGQSIDVAYTIRVPAGATPGGHYGVLFAETLPSEKPDGTAIARKKRVGAILYATVKGDVKTSGQYEKSDVPFFQNQAPLRARQLISNHGNTDFSVHTTVEVSDVLGGVKYKNDMDLSVLPSSSRNMINDWQSPSWIGVYKVTLTASFLDTNHTTTQYVLLVPYWVYVLLVVLVGARVLYGVARHNRKK